MPDDHTGSVSACVTSYTPRKSGPQPTASPSTVVSPLTSNEESCPTVDHRFNRCSTTCSLSGSSGDPWPRRRPPALPAPPLPPPPLPPRPPSPRRPPPPHPSPPPLPRPPPPAPGPPPPRSPPPARPCPAQPASIVHCLQQLASRPDPCLRQRPPPALSVLGPGRTFTLRSGSAGHQRGRPPGSSPVDLRCTRPADADRGRLCLQQ